MTPAQCRTTAIKFLYRYYPKLIKMDYEQVVGELTGQILGVLPQYDPQRGKMTTFLYHVCNTYITKYRNRDKKFLERHHFTNDLSRFEVENRTPSYLAQQEELEHAVRNSGLPKRTKEIVLSLIDDPQLSMESLGELFGLTRQAANLHVMSARKYLERRGIDICS